MKICHITTVHANRYDSRIFTKECVSLAKAGYDVTLLVNDELPDEVKMDVEILSMRVPVRGRVDRATRVVNMAFKRAVKINAEIYHLHDPELLQLVYRFERIGKKVIFDAHEDTEAQIIDKRYIPFYIRKMFAQLYGVFCRKCMMKCEGIITVTPKIVDKYLSYNKNTIMITNYPIVCDELDGNINHDIEIKEDYVVFAGGISEQWCHENIIKAVKMLDGVKYKYAGIIDEEYRIHLNAIDNKSSEYIGFLNHDEVKSLYKTSIAGMALLQCNQVSDEGTLGNTKMFEIMLAGKPVICSDLRLWREIVEEYECGLCVDCNSVEEIAWAINYICTHEREAKMMGENGKRAVEEKYNWNSQEEKLVNFYKKLC